MTRNYTGVFLTALCTGLFVANLYGRQPSSQLSLSTISREDERVEEPPAACDTPSMQPRYIGMGTITSDSASGFLEPVTGVDGYLVIISTNSKSGFVPVIGTTYTAGSTVGNGKVIKTGPGTSFTATGLSGGTDYHVYVFSMKNNCPGGPVYRSYNPATVLFHTP